jgi:hypothetical protein
MLVSRVSLLTGNRHLREINVTQEQLDRWEAGEDLIQNICPSLSADDREFIMTGATPEEWNEHFGEDS